MATAQTASDAAIEPARDQHGPAGASRQKAHAGIAALVVALGDAEHLARHQADGFGIGVATDQVVGGDAVDAEAFGGQVHAPGLRVFEHVARDVGELHGDAEVDGVSPRARVTDVEHGAHHQADRTRGPIAIAKELSVGLEPDHAEVGRHAREQLAHHAKIDALLDAQHTKPTVLRGPKGLAVGLGLERGLERGEIPARLRCDRPSVDQVVDATAKGIERRHFAALRAAQKGRRPTERTRMKGKHLPLRGLAGECLCLGGHAVTVSGRERTRPCVSACGTTRSSTLADESTPGSPAPG